MAITDTSAPVSEAEAAEAGSPVPEPGGLAGLLGTGDHKALGRAWIGFALVYGLLAFLLAALSAYGQISRTTYPSATSAFRIATTSRLGMVLLFLLPLFIGLATYITPLQVGARTIAFPRAAALALWTFAAASILWVGSTAAGGGFRALDAKLVDLSLLSLGLAVVAILVACVCIVTTILTLRTPGLWLDRIPLFSWSMLVAATLWLLQLPVFLADLALVYLGHHYGGEAGATFGAPAEQWALVSWLVQQPAVFAVAIPALGIGADALGTLSKKRSPSSGMLRVGIGLAGALAFGAWAQPAFVDSIYSSVFFMVASVAVALPFLIVLGGYARTAASGKPRPVAAVGASVAGLLLLVLGGIASAMFVVQAWKLGDEGPSPAAVSKLATELWGQPAWQVGLCGLVVAATSIVGLGGLFYWGSKITGRQLSDLSGKLAVGLGAIGALLFAVPYLVIGFSIVKPSIGESGTLDTLSWVSVIGASLVLLSLLVAIYALMASLGGDQAADDAWGCGQTLEWTTSSPPARGNFGEIPLVQSSEPLLDRATDGQEVAF